MKTTMSAVLGLAMIAASAFAAQDAPKTATAPKTDAHKMEASKMDAPTVKVKKHKKSVKTTTTSAKPVVTPAPASK